MGEIADDLFDSMMDIDDAVFSQPRHRKRKPSGPGPCPTCGGKTVIKKGPYGTFYGCVDFPRCKGTRGGDGSPLPKGLGPCPICEATTVKRKGPYGEFYGCSKWPKCSGKRSGETPEEIEERMEQIAQTTRQVRKTFKGSMKERREAIDALSEIAGLINRSACEARNLQEFF